MQSRQQRNRLCSRGTIGLLPTHMNPFSAGRHIQKNQEQQLTGRWQSSMHTADMAENPQSDRQKQRQFLGRTEPVHLRDWCGRSGTREETLRNNSGMVETPVGPSASPRSLGLTKRSLDARTLSLPLSLRLSLSSLSLSLSPIKR